MKAQILKVIPITLASISLILSHINLANAQQVKIGQNLKPDPTTLTGKSGGSNKSNCGNISTTPSQVLQVTEALPYLRLTVESAGKPTLLIDGPGGRFCVLADNYSGGKPEISGFWQAGNYSLYIGELSQAQYNYTLSISQQKK
ncbi:hypothetical protein [Calothrix sp. PCC 6303]|uniref:hypothetical protein n=1 Tax=Calothrix sp. PCC 6303 TaxID=1170562 RepID=UPI0002A026C5|nr:hypothetical protein [Calothrix sp. PCC 6303]AFY99245.1 hypothetical protein Cal6303_0137 [Calothrix sp. PCC 6303]